MFEVDGFVAANDSGDEGGKGQDIRGIMLGAGTVIEDIEAERDNFLVMIEDVIKGGRSAGFCREFQEFLQYPLIAKAGREGGGFGLRLLGS